MRVLYRIGRPANMAEDILVSSVYASVWQYQVASGLFLVPIKEMILALRLARYELYAA